MLNFSVLHYKDHYNLATHQHFCQQLHSARAQIEGTQE